MFRTDDQLCYTMDAFEEYLVATFPKDTKRTGNAVILQQFEEQIISFLKNPLCIENANTRHFVKRRGFQLLDLPEAGIRGSLVVQVEEENGGNWFCIRIHYAVFDYNLLVNRTVMITQS